MNIFRKVWQKKYIKRVSDSFMIRSILCEWLRESDPDNLFNIGIAYKVTITGFLKLYSTHPGTLIGKGGHRYFKYKKLFIQHCDRVHNMELYELKDFVDGKDAEIKCIGDII